LAIGFDRRSELAPGEYVQAMRRTAPRFMLSVVALGMAGACSAGSDVVIADTQRVTTDVTDEPTDTTAEPTDTTAEPTDTTAEPPDTTEPPPDSDPDTTPPDTEPSDTLPPEDPNSSTTVVEPVDAADTYALGTEVLIDEVGLKVLEYIPDATAQAESAYLEVPEGWQAVAVRSALTNYAPVPALYYYVDLLLVGPDGTAFPQSFCSGPPWEPDLGYLSLMPGGAGEGITCFIVPNDAVDDLVLSANNYNSTPARFALAVDAGTKTAPAIPARPAVPTPGSSTPGTWKSPLPLATPGTIGDYTIAITAFTESVPTPEYAVAPPEGWRYVAADLDVTFNGTDVADAGFTDLSVVGDGGRLYREDFNCALDDEGDPYEPEPGVPQHWSRCFVVPDSEVATLEVAFSAGFTDELLFLAVR
jgi:hypothetical protein